MKAFNISIDKLQPIKLILFILVPMFIPIFASDYFNVESSEIFLVFWGVYVNFIYYFWLWMIGKNLMLLRNTKHKQLFQSALIIMVFFVVIPLLITINYLFNASEYQDAFSTVFNSKIDELMLNDLSWIYYVSTGYISYFFAKNIRELEEGKSLRFRQYFGTFILIFFLPVINIFFIQPRIKKVMDRNQEDASPPK